MRLIQTEQGEYHDIYAKCIQTTLKRDLTKIDGQIDGLVERIIDTTNTTVQSAFERKIDKLERDKLVLHEKLQNGPSPKRSFEQMFELAMAFLSNPWKLWESDRLEDKRTVLKLTFSERLGYCRKTGFRTPKPDLA